MSADYYSTSECYFLRYCMKYHMRSCSLKSFLPPESLLVLYFYQLKHRSCNFYKIYLLFDSSKNYEIVMQDFGVKLTW